MLTLNLAPEIEAGLLARAKDQGMSLEDYLAATIRLPPASSAPFDPGGDPNHPTQADAIDDEYSRIRADIRAAGSKMLDDEELRVEIRARRGLRPATGR